jgi:hypothetical protein
MLQKYLLFPMDTIAILKTIPNVQTLDMPLQPHNRKPWAETWPENL